MMKTKTQLIKLFLYFLFYLPIMAQAMELSAIAQLSRQGAPQLALKLIQQHQPEFENDSTAWYAWESQRLQILESRSAWQTILSRSSNHPVELAEDFVLWREQLLVKAHLTLRQGELARERLAHLLWAESVPAEAEIQRYRDLIIRSYMVEGKTEVAHISMLRYQQDYPAQEQDTVLLRAEVLLASERYADAKGILSSLKEEYPQLLLMLAQLRLHQGLQQKHLKKLRWLSSRDDVPVPEQYLAWGIRAEYYFSRSNLKGAILAQERLLALNPGENDFFPARGQRLWLWYEKLALELANSRRLLQGDDRSWLQLAKKNNQAEPIESRALYARIATDSQDIEIRETAHKALIESLLGLNKGEAIAEALYRPLYSQQGELWPTRVKYFLAERALIRGDVTEASRYLLSLDHAPEGENNINWNLRRARVLIMAGLVEQGNSVLQHLISANKLNTKQIDKLMQVLFDLQTVQAHEQAIALFQSLLRRSKSLKLQRELHFWIADSYEAMGEYEKASFAYFESAAASGGGDGILWAQSARYQAARALASAGLLEDARGIFTTLLQATKDEGRKARLRHEMQLLQLKQIEVQRMGG
ncbi:MAG: hypothetical protein OEX12_02695 [Gammaproteobacteria bacterium]|nr:hypothetical protein [Gammaproteobacteria bacterium]